MSFNLWQIVIVYGYFALFFFGILLIAFLSKKRRKVRVPVQFRLLRGPGETLRKRVAKYDEDIMFHIGAAAMFPFVTSFPAWLVMLTFKPTTWTQFNFELGLMILLFVLGLLLSGRWALKRLYRYRDDHLGYLGEREVAEYMQPLLAKGYRVFHDAPAEGAAKDFNLDHVAVGPNGVAVVEVKTRRKGHARPGYKDHVVVYDGQQLIWPWGEDRHGLEQAKAEADWLRKWIKQRTGIETPVKAILALPGWWVEMRARGEVTVVNSKSVASAVEGRSLVVLNAEQIDLIARQLDLVCRDVEA